MSDDTFVDNPDHPIVLNDDDMDKAIAKYPFLVVDCWAEWCAPCRMLGPIIESLAKKNQGEIVFAKIDVENNQKTASKYGIRSIPNLIIFKNGEKVGDIVGALPENKLMERINTFK